MSQQSTTISIGTYSGGLLGYELSCKEHGDDDSVRVGFTAIFGYSPHTGCIKTLRSVDNLLLTGSSDETIRIFHVGTRKETGILSEHSSSVSAIDICVAGSKFAMSGSEDGRLCLWKGSKNNWEMLMHLKGHTAAIASIAIHPSSSLALTVSGQPENALRLWDLMRGTCAVSQKFTNSPISVKWSAGAKEFAVLFAKNVVVRSASSPTAECVISSPDDNSFCKLPTLLQLESSDYELIMTREHLSLLFRSDTTMNTLRKDHLVLGTSKGGIIGYKMSTSPGDGGEIGLTTSLVFRTGSSSAAGSRIKAVCGVPTLDGSEDLWFISADSVGIISLWVWDGEEETIKESTLITDSQARITAMDCNFQSLIIEDDEIISTGSCCE